ncbi:unnamed protein product [Ilex paraguariensis]|uniref:Transmembrane protein 53 n=1 Tax=Ilex paraguariensis TaxID=185542 RepID=A0ABC8S6D3_9AQUA
MAMEASTKIFNVSNRQFSNSLLLRTHPLNLSPKSLRSPFPNLPPNSLSPPHNHCYKTIIQSKALCSTCIHFSLSHPSIPSFNSTPLGFSQSQIFNPLISSNRFARVVSGSKDKSFQWNYALEGVDGRDLGILGDKGPIVTVVLLGWLGAKLKHLRRYVELYNSRGIHAVTFVASVRDVLSFDLGRKLQERISEFAQELTTWLSETEKDGRERVLLFHTFSNTGWLAYGAILDTWQDREDLLMKIKGCVVDSGGDPDINPKVWAAGFTAALLQKRSSSVYPSVNPGEQNELSIGDPIPMMQEKEPPLIESLLLFAFEKLFAFLLNLPDVNQRLMKNIAALSKKQPPCPQLYLYSSADKVIPFRSVELFIDDQRRMGRKVWFYNFGTTPHVDHYRTFPDLYTLQLQNFLKECVAMVKQV